VRKTQPAVYMKICALVPREMKVEHAGTIKQMSDEQIEEAIAAIKAMLAARAGETAKVIEGGSWPSFASLNPQAWRSMCGWIGNGILAASPRRWISR